MSTKKSFFLLKVVIPVLLISSFANADDPVDDSFGDIMNEPTNGSMSLESDNSGIGQSVTIFNEDPKRDLHAMYGWSLGFQSSNESYKSNVDLVDSNNTISSRRVFAESDSFLNMGVVGRYAILPVDRLGSDLNLSFMQSTNNAPTGESVAQVIIKGEVNLAYTWAINKGFKIYALLGGGFQNIQGVLINKTIERAGSGGQAGLGFNFGMINVEAMYSYYRHKISSDQYYSYYLKSSDPSMRVNSKSSYAEASGIVGRATFNF
ncbi:MAG: hypothetical protein H7061_12840 [Bdellovibrionaceae bacterium]|nr:hypothetical protein [Bdellovibrio sp.]